jgi:L-alanine-DL-glutamate epimerase-like enolase superfamily enzyme
MAVQPGHSFNIGPDLPLNLGNVIVRITTDDGLEGLAGTTTYSPPRSVAYAVADTVRPILMGRDALEREAIWQRLYDVGLLMASPQAIAVVDCALWDLAGKAAELPIYKLMGAYRTRLPAYASTLTYGSIDEFRREVQKMLDEGFRAVKFHTWGEVNRDIELCRAMRQLAGDDIALMVDAAGAYDRAGAIKVGRAIQDLGYEWLEMPIRDQDVEGYAALAAELDILVTSGEMHTYGFQDAGNYIMRRAWDILRIDACNSFGITATKKTCALAEAFNLRCEIHSWGFTLNQAANLQVMGAVRNCRYFEMPVPTGIFDFGMKDVIEIDSEGMVTVPDKPGIGVEVDWERMESATVLAL